jgi:hypothetical protein
VFAEETLVEQVDRQISERLGKELAASLKFHIALAERAMSEAPKVSVRQRKCRRERQSGFARNVQSYGAGA